jgi:hypothetical protein
MNKNNINLKNNTNHKNNNIDSKNNNTNHKNNNIDSKNNNIDSKNNNIEIDNNNKINNIATDSLYNNLDLSEHLNKIKIYFTYELNYLNYKKKLMKFIQNDYEKIIEIFDDKFNDEIINIYILKKKKKITDNDFVLFNLYYDFIKLINKFNYIDQEEFLTIIINFYNINSLSNKIINFFKNYYFNDLIDYNYIITKINTIYQIINKNNIILKTFDILGKSNITDSYKNNIRNLAKIISFDFFMYYDSHQMFNKILNELLSIYKYINLKHNNKSGLLEDYKSGLLEEYFIILDKFKKSKNIFIDEYQKNYNNHTQIYKKDNELDIKMKFKSNTNDKIQKLVDNLKFIDEIE